MSAFPRVFSPFSVCSLILSLTLLPVADVSAQTSTAAIEARMLAGEHARAAQGELDALLWMGESFRNGRAGLPRDLMLADAFFRFALRTRQHRVSDLSALEKQLTPGQRAQAEWLAQREDAKTLVAVADDYLQK